MLPRTGGRPGQDRSLGPGAPTGQAPVATRPGAPLAGPLPSQQAGAGAGGRGRGASGGAAGGRGSLARVGQAGGGVPNHPRPT